MKPITLREHCSRISRIKTPKRAAASRENGLLGGRPGSKLKVFGGHHFAGPTLGPFDYRQTRVIVAATSRKQVVELLNQHGLRSTLWHIRYYWCVTRNATELTIALANPGQVFASTDGVDGRNFAEVRNQTKTAPQGQE